MEPQARPPHPRIPFIGDANIYGRSFLRHTVRVKMNFFGFGSSARITVKLDRPHSEVEAGEKRVISPFADAAGGTGQEMVFTAYDAVKGKVYIDLPGGKKIDHTGIKVDLIGQIEYKHDMGSKHPFTALVRELEAPGTLFCAKQYSFEFANVEKQYDSYEGINCRLRYFIRVTISRQYAPNIRHYEDFIVRNYTSIPEINNSIKMEVGIEDCLHIEFEYEREHYHLSDIILGKIYFVLVRIKIKHMELQLVRKESVGSGQTAYNDNEILSKFELMDGAPVRGEVTPIRFFLAPLALSPTMKNIHHKFSSKYVLNLVLIDEEERRYFKQHEIVLHRVAPSEMSK